MSDSSRPIEFRDALDNWERNPQGLSTGEREELIRQIEEQARHHADKASREGKVKEAAALYRLCSRAHRDLAGLMPGDLRELELAAAKFWEEHAELIEKYQDTPPAVEGSTTGVEITGHPHTEANSPCAKNQRRTQTDGQIPRVLG